MRIVLLPGMDGGATLSSAFVAQLSKEHTVVAIEYPTDEGSIGVLTELVLDAVAAWTDTVLIAESFSGPIAIETMARRPDAFRQGILFCTFVLPPRPAALRSLIRPPLLRRAPPPWAIRRWMLDTDAPERSVAQVQNAIARVPSAVMTERVRNVLSVDARDSLRSIPVPVSSVRARHDRLVVARSAPEVYARVPSVTIDAPHLAIHARPAICARVVESRLRGAPIPG